MVEFCDDRSNRTPGPRLPASYANFYIAKWNRAVAAFRAPNDTCTADPGEAMPSQNHRSRFDRTDLGARALPLHQQQDRLKMHKRL